MHLNCLHTYFHVWLERIGEIETVKRGLNRETIALVKFK